METLADFVDRLSKGVGCYYHRLERSGLYPLKRNNTMQPGNMGVFAFVLGLRDRFRIHTSKGYAIAAEVLHLFDETRPRIWFGKPGVLIFIRKDSNGEDYQRAVKAFTAIKNLNN